jgi:hypothetical protein
MSVLDETAAFVAACRAVGYTRETDFDQTRDDVRAVAGS